MPKFRKRPSIVDAVQWWPGHEVDGVVEVPARDVPSRGGGIAFTMPAHFVVKAHDGTKSIHPGDWVITGASGGRSVCPDERFRNRYEPAD